MRKPRRSNQDREKIVENIARNTALNERRHRLYNIKYRKSTLFVTTLFLRLFFILFLIFTYFFHGGHGRIQSEAVLETKSGIYMSTSGGRLGSSGTKLTVISLSILTNVQKYEAHFVWTSPPLVYIGDTILIERNFFDKPIYFIQRNNSTKYELAFNWIWYLIALLVTIISFFFNDGLDRFTDKILWVAWTVDLIAIGCYLLG